MNQCGLHVIEYDCKSNYWDTPFAKFKDCIKLINYISQIKINQSNTFINCGNLEDECKSFYNFIQSVQ